MPKVFSGYAKLPDNTTAQKLYNHFGSGGHRRVLHGDHPGCRLHYGHRVGRRFIRELLVATREPEGQTLWRERLNQSYYGHLRMGIADLYQGDLPSVWGNSPGAVPLPNRPPLRSRFPIVIAL